MKSLRKVLFGTAVGALIAGCGGASYAPPTPPLNAEVIINSSGVTPKALTVTLGARVTFRNQDTTPHHLISHPGVTTISDCPELNLAVLQPGEAVTVQMGNSARVCTYFDQLNPNAMAFEGSIAVGPTSGGYGM